MRYAPDHKAKTRRRILSAAARRFRERGYRGAGVDEVMRSAGLTAGGFYAHFAWRGSRARTGCGPWSAGT
jgi:TetR/AcrR family transcriptional regulator, transcriptional repressor for nem operon